MIAIPSRTSGALFVAACLCGCVTQGMAGAEPVPAGNGVYTIGSEPGSGEGIHSESYQRAIRFCFDQGRQLLRLDGQPGMPQQAGIGVHFRCVGPGEPGWKEPVG
jgi:hypothetical protein